MYRAFSHPNLQELYKYIAIVITLCTLGGCATNVETHGKAPEVTSEEIATALKDSERLFAERAEIEKIREASKRLSAVRNPDDRDFEVEWNLAKYSYFLGKAEADQEKASEAFEKGRDAGRVAARVDKSRPEGHFWFAANLGELAKINPLTVGIKSVDDIRESMQTVIAIAPRYQDASAFDALGQLEMATRNFKGGKAEKAIEYFEKGVELSPDNANLRLHLAEAYLAVNRDNDARKQIDTLISMQPNPEYAIEHAAAVTKARKLIDRNF